MSYFLFFCSLLALVFFLYTVKNKAKLGVSWTHPRIWVEAILCIGFLIAGIIVLT